MDYDEWKPACETENGEDAVLESSIAPDSFNRSLWGYFFHEGDRRIRFMGLIMKLHLFIHWINWSSFWAWVTGFEAVLELDIIDRIERDVP